MDIDSKDIAALQASVNDAAQKLRAPWVALLSASAYLGLAISNISHQDLLLETPLKLPLVNVDLALIAFGYIAPLLLLILEFNFLLAFTFLAERVDTYRLVLMEQYAAQSDRVRLNQRLTASIFAQLLIGAESFGARKWLRLLSVVVFHGTIVLAPLLVSYLLLIVFLPYQDELLSWWQRGAFVIAVVAMWWSLPRILMPKMPDVLQQSTRRIRFWKRSGQAVKNLVAVVILVAAIVVPHFPGEFVAKIERAGVSSPFPNRLTLRDLSLVDAELVDRLDTIDDDTREGVGRHRLVRSLRGRKFVGAVFDRSDLRRADFSGALLVDASFVDARLDRASFGCLPRNVSTTQIADSADHRSMNGGGDGFGEGSDEFINPSCTNLTRVNFRGASLQESWLTATIMHGADLSSATFHGAVLAKSELYGADLTGARARGAQFSGAKLVAAQLAGSVMDYSDFRGVDFTGADLTNASFAWTLTNDSNFSGARLWGTQFLRAYVAPYGLIRADLRRTRFWGAQTDVKRLADALSTDHRPLVWYPSPSPQLRLALAKKDLFDAPRIGGGGGGGGDGGGGGFLPYEIDFSQPEIPPDQHDAGIDVAVVDMSALNVEQALKSLGTGIKYPSTLRRMRDNAVVSQEAQLTDFALFDVLNSYSREHRATPEFVSRFQKQQVETLADAVCSSHEAALIVAQRVLSMIPDGQETSFLGHIAYATYCPAFKHIGPIGWGQLKDLYRRAPHLPMLSVPQ